MKNLSQEDTINVGWGGDDVSIADLASVIAAAVGYHGRFVYDSSKPDGTLRTALDTSRLSTLGWNPSIRREEALRNTRQ